MATPSSPSNVQGNRDNSPNHPTSSTVGGSSAYPTPANNVGGGSGWGDEGFWKGGSAHGQGHQNAPAPKSTIGGFLGLKQQKTAAESRTEERFDRAGGHVDKNTQSGGPTCESEDHTFMEHKPGCSGTLSGWGKTKNAFGMSQDQGR